MRYRCLILDHDDTAVDSTGRVHYPAHVEAMRQLRPGQAPVDLETWFAKNFDPGIVPYLEDELGMTAEELLIEDRIWREYTARLTPPFFPGFLEALAEYVGAGGRFVVASHSEARVIREHYRAASNGAGLMPELVFGWELGVDRRKPFPYPVEQTLSEFGLAPGEVLVVDDLKPGVDMARTAGVAAAAACWSHRIPQVQEFMRQNCVATFESVDEFRDFVLA